MLVVLTPLQFRLCDWYNLKNQKKVKQKTVALASNGFFERLGFCSGKRPPCICLVMHDNNTIGTDSETSSWDFDNGANVSTSLSAETSHHVNVRPSYASSSPSAFVYPGLPPICNTEVINTQPILNSTEGAKVGETITPEYLKPVTGWFVDWLSLTVPSDVADWRTVRDWLTPFNKSENDWVGLPHGMHGYRSGIQRDTFKILHDGLDGMGTHIILSGSACRQLTEEYGLSESSWVDLLVRLKAARVKVARLDVAKDDTDGLLSFPVIADSLRSGTCSSHFKGWKRRVEEEGNFAKEGSSPTGETLYFGSRKSEMYVRIYNKKLEQLQDEESPEWVRVESEFKDRKASELIDMIAEVRSFHVVGSLLARMIDFKVPDASDSNRARWSSVEWWSAFLSHVPKALRRTRSRVEKTLDHVRGWLGRQAAQSVAVLVDSIQRSAVASGLSPRAEVAKWFYSLVEDGRGRYRSKHLQLLASFEPIPGVLFS